MTFANRFASLLATGLLLVPAVYSQDESIDDSAPPPNVEGLFDDPPGLTPIDDGAIERSRPGPRPADESFPPSASDESEMDISPIERPSRFGGGGRSFGSSPSSGKKGSFKFADKIPNRAEKLRMDFVQVEIEEVVKYFAEQLKLRFIYDPTILSGKVTIVSPEPVTMDEAYQAFLSAMEIRGYVIFPSGPYFKIDKVTNARKSPVPLYLDSTPKDDSYVTRIISLKFLNVRDIRQAVRDLVSRSGGDVIEHAPTNTLIISDYAANIRRIIRILNILDVEGFQEQIAVVALQFASAGDVARKINDIFPTGGANSGVGGGRRTASGAGSSANQSVIQKVVSDDRTNSLIILGSERGIQQVKAFISQIDVSIDGGEGGIYVYPLQNVKAEEIANTLASLTSGKKADTPGSGSRAVNNRGGRPLGEIPGASPIASAGAAGASLFDGDVKITSDNTTNSLVIQASRRDFEVLKTIISQLDIRRRQVFIESIILEASLGNGLSYGTQASGPAFKTNALGRKPNTTNRTKDTEESAGVFGFGNLSEKDALGTLSGLLGTGVASGLALGFRAGGSVPVQTIDKDGNAKTVNVPLLSAIVRLAANNSRLNLISTPHILATANQPANISIGEEVPQLGSSQPTSSGEVLQSFVSKKIATELTITPQINAGDYLTLEIDQKVNEVKGEPNANTGQVTTTTREAKTTAIVKDRQTIVIGGIMRDRTITSETKVPLLGDIPILGWLFKSRTKGTDKTNLLLFFTPTIVKDDNDMSDIFFQKLKEREGVLKEIGLGESKKIPISGYSRDQLKFLDESYLKSFELRNTERTTSKEAPLPSLDAPIKIDSPAQPNFQKSLPDNLPTIPVAPRQMAPDEPLEIEMGSPKRIDDVIAPSSPGEPEPSTEPFVPVPGPEDSPSLSPTEAPLLGPAPESSAPTKKEGDLPSLDKLLEEDNGTEG